MVWSMPSLILGIFFLSSLSTDTTQPFLTRNYWLRGKVENLKKERLEVNGNWQQKPRGTQLRKIEKKRLITLIRVHTITHCIPVVMAL